jgi:hypothetical protein
MSRGTSRTGKPCPACGKRSFSSRQAARRACRTLSNRIRVYLCPACHGFHITSQIKLDAWWN